MAAQAPRGLVSTRESVLRRCCDIDRSAVLGLVIGAAFVQFASWNWIFWLVTIICAPVVGITIFLIPNQETKESKNERTGWKDLDIIGVSILAGEHRAFSLPIQTLTLFPVQLPSSSSFSP